MFEPAVRLRPRMRGQRRMDESTAGAAVASVEKLTISFDPGLVATIRAAAAEEGVSVSMWLAGAAEAKARRRRFREALDSFAAEHGALSDMDIDRLIGEA